VVFAGHRLAVPDALLQARTGLDSYFGRDVVLGIRPSDFEDASLAEAAWPRLPVDVSVTEELGSEIHVIFAIDAAPVQHASISDARDTDGDDEAIPLAADKTQWTARVAARSGIKPHSAAQLAIDTSNLQFFDPASGLAIGHPAN
jgi:multiple sugar transport system ATP-binding protein